MSELRSWIGRNFFSKYPPDFGEGRRFCNLGCGDKHFPHFVNADFFLPFNFKKHQNKPDWMLDLRYPFKCKDNFWDGVFSEHTLEHLTFKQAKMVLTEIYRTLRPGGWVRVVLPDLTKILNYYFEFKKNHILNATFMAQMQWNDSKTSADIIEHLVYKWGHLSVWDAERLCKVLLELDFKNIQEVSFLEGRSQQLLIDQEFRKIESFYVEAQKK